MTSSIRSPARRIAEAEVAGFDETGLRVAGALHWVHCARTGKHPLITCHRKRGHQGIDDAGVLGRFHGVAARPAQIGLTFTAARSNPLIRKYNALARRLLERQDDYLRFTTDWRIPPDNNGAKRDIRMIKLRQKISGGPLTLIGATQFCAIRSCLSSDCQAWQALRRSPCHARRGPLATVGRPVVVR